MLCCNGVSFVSSGCKEAEVWHWTQGRNYKRDDESTRAVVVDAGSKIMDSLEIHGLAVISQ